MPVYAVPDEFLAAQIIVRIGLGSTLYFVTLKIIFLACRNRGGGMGKTRLLMASILGKLRWVEVSC